MQETFQVRLIRIAEELTTLAKDLSIRIAYNNEQAKSYRKLSSAVLRAAAVAAEEGI